MKLSVKTWTASLAILGGAYVSLAALLEMMNLQVWWFNSQMFSLLNAAFPGLSATWNGVLVGLVAGAFCGALCGWIFSALHNALLKRLE